MSAVPEISNITIREINDVAQMRAVEELQKEVWGIPDLDVVPMTHLVAAREAGGVLIGAFDGDALLGFVYGFPSFERGQLAHHSHMLAVKPGYRNLDLGRRLKLAQREHVIGQGIDLVSWTFDPLQSRNAHFNFTKLGVIADRYLPNFYGEDAASFLHQTGTDRLWVSWFVSSERVERLISGATEEISLDDEQVTIDIPSDIDSLPRETALRLREETRTAFTEALKAGYVVQSFVRDKAVGKYILSRKKAQKAQKNLFERRKLNEGSV
jgi:predicted GNAT superfamily acetyltransferase